MRRILIGVCLMLAACSPSDDGDTSDTAPSSATSAPNATKLSTAAELPVPRTEVAGTAVEGRIVVVGGLTADGSASSLAHVYEPDTDEWRAAPDLPAPVHHTAVVAVGDRAFVIGGYTTSASGQWQETAAVWSWADGDPAWRAEPALPEPRGALAAAATEDGTIVAVGGVATGQVLTSTVVLRPGEATWEPGPELDEPREHVGATAIDGRIFAIGGRVASLESNKRTVESWDPSGREGSWREEPQLNDTRGGTAAAGRCVAGGEEPTGTIASIECLSDDGDEWQVVADLTTPRHGLAVVELDGTIHVIGGGPQPGLTVSGAHETYETDTSRDDQD